jgi:2,3-bisphosphoglycerate-independent phosphoglycerate mutase
MIALLFVDGLGLSQDPRSPVGPFLEALCAPLQLELEATLGVPDLPQSGTGQTSLLTGINAAQLLGYSQGPHPGSRLQAVLREHSLQVWARRQGLQVLHANGYRAAYLDRVAHSRRNLLSAFGYAARAAGIPLLPLEDARALPPGDWPDPEVAGARFAELTREAHLVILEYWRLDWAGHRAPEEIPARLGELLSLVQGFLEARVEEESLVLVSDHGNAEEPWHPQHTRNPVPLLAWGPLATLMPRPIQLTDVAPWLRQALVLVKKPVARPEEPDEA